MPHECSIDIILVPHSKIYFNKNKNKKQKKEEKKRDLLYSYQSGNHQ